MALPPNDCNLQLHCERGRLGVNARPLGNAPTTSPVMERVEAEAILDGDREVALVLLMRVGELVEAKSAPGKNRTCARGFGVNARREVLLMPAPGRMLREHRIGSPHSQPGDYVFTRPGGRAMHPAVVRKHGLHPAVKNAGIDQLGKPRLLSTICVTPTRRC